MQELGGPLDIAKVVVDVPTLNEGTLVPRDQERKVGSHSTRQPLRHQFTEVVDKTDGTVVLQAFSINVFRKES
uniref:Uncharacterized protein n=1 Tax=Arundo donax TaxID=35708 RepID=A0A0A9AXZ0_ARUDO